MHKFQDLSQQMLKNSSFERTLLITYDAEDSVGAYCWALAGENYLFGRVDSWERGEGYVR